MMQGVWSASKISVSIAIREGERWLARMRKFDVGGSSRADLTTEMFWPISHHELRAWVSRVLHP
jgi:hypothetical protein